MSVTIKSIDDAFNTEAIKKSRDRFGVNDRQSMDPNRVARCINAVIKNTSNPDIVEADTIDEIHELEKQTGFKISSRIFGHERKPDNNKRREFVTDEINDDYLYLTRLGKYSHNAMPKHYNTANSGALKQIDTYNEQLRSRRVVRENNNNNDLRTVANNLLKSRVQITHSFYHSGVSKKSVTKIGSARRLFNVDD